MKIGVLLCNLGTPSSTELKDVKRYLKQFLSDKYVLDINPLARWLLVNLVIVPFRSPKSQEAYKQVWTERGSPLLVLSQDQKNAVAKKLADLGVSASVELGMRYGEPSIKTALERLEKAGAEKIIFVPLYPQYALSSTATAEEDFLKYANGRDIVNLSTLPFYAEDGFTSAWANNIKEHVSHLSPDKKPSHYVFSYHGLPERHVRKTETQKGKCQFNNDCCKVITEGNRYCYRAHCLQTTLAIAKKLGITESQWTMSFQSRLGRDPWLQPNTEIALEGLAKKGVANVFLVSPSFVADCLETLEELQIRAKELFVSHGGKNLVVSESLNSRPDWIEFLVSYILKNQSREFTNSPFVSTVR